MNYFLIAGEASGDLHAASLIHQIKERDPQARFAALGGNQMQAAGCFLYRHYKHMAFMGFVAVLKNTKSVLENFRIARAALLKEQPDALILIDYPSFNLKMASFCRKHLPNTKIYYYIPPKVWAWKSWRVHKIARLCDRILGIFPFESAFYARYGYQCTYVGNPTQADIAHYLQKEIEQHLAKTKTIVLLPGSRASEVSHCLDRMLNAARRFPDYQIVVCGAPGLDDEFYSTYLLEQEQLTRDTYSAVRKASVAIVNSGTATLETALLGCPQVAVYHLACPHLLGMMRGLIMRLFSIPYFTPVNIIAGKEVIRECMVENFTVEKVAAEVQRLLTDTNYTKNMLADYEHISQVLTPPDGLSAAEVIVSDLHQARN